MTEPTPIRAHRRYTRRQKAVAVIAAEMATVAAAAEGAGIPETTVRYWMERPEFVLLRAKTREDIAVETRTLAVKVLGEIERRIGDFEPRDLSILYGILTDKGQLLAGEATARTEHRELLDGASDETVNAVEGWLLDVARQRMATDAAE